MYHEIFLLVQGFVYGSSNCFGLTIRNPGMNTVLSSVAHLQYSSKTWIPPELGQYEILKSEVRYYRY